MDDKRAFLVHSDITLQSFFFALSKCSRSVIQRQVIVDAADQITVDERSCLRLVVIVQSADIHINIHRHILYQFDNFKLQRSWCASCGVEKSSSALLVDCTRGVWHQNVRNINRKCSGTVLYVRVINLHVYFFNRAVSIEYSISIPSYRDDN